MWQSNWQTVDCSAYPRKMWSPVLTTVLSVSLMIPFAVVSEGRNVQECKFEANNTVAYLAVTPLKRQRLVSLLRCDVECSQTKDCMIIVFNRSISLCAMFRLFRPQDGAPTILHGNFDVRHFMMNAETPIYPSCVSQPPSLENANVSEGSQIVGSVRTYTCHQGYRDMSSNEMAANTTCLRNLTWNYPTLRCSVLKCPSQPPSLKNADISDGPKVLGSIRTYTCRHGYRDTSTNEITANTACLGNLTWSHPALKCSIPTCLSQPPSIKNANVSDGSQLVGSVRTYTCHHGYRATSTNEMTANTTCLGNLTWSHPALQCLVPSCLNQSPSLKNADISDGPKVVGSIRTYTCHHVPTCLSQPPSIKNANVSDGSQLVGSVRTYTCHHGYRDTSTDEMTANTTCLGNLTWSLPALQCLVERCPNQPPALKHAIVSRGDQLVGSVRTYTCRDGYRDPTTRKKTANIKCLRSLSWSWSTLKCSPHSCPSPPPPINKADVSGKSRVVGSVWKYKCHRGYIDTKPKIAKTRCLENLRWSPIGLICSGPWVLKVTPKTVKGREYIGLTPNEEKKVFVDTTLVFKVKTCHDANVNYGEYEESEFNQKFEDKISIGGGENTYWKIAGCSPIYEKDIVSCTEFRSFWIRFHGHTIAMGRGLTVGERRAISCTKSEIDLKHLRFSTYVRNKGVWLFKVHVG